MDKDELIDWYLELKEEEIQDVDELEYEKELITKMLRKLVKVRVTRISSLLVHSNVILPGSLSAGNSWRRAGFPPAVYGGKQRESDNGLAGRRTPCLLHGPPVGGYR